MSMRELLFQVGRHYNVQIAACQFGTRWTSTSFFVEKKKVIDIAEILNTWC